ncbi:MAG: hypothetical protein J5I93_23380, partial [Pirellulaceae bacterium]|nr:hypothetical protein [Pirellulaceae bacterium]
MEPFSITCTTCGARLTVRSQAAIGQILGCPRCKSMVLVERPAAAGSAAPDLSETLDSLPGDDGLATSPAGPLASDSAWAETLPELDVGDAQWSGEPADTAEGRARWKDQQAAASTEATARADEAEGMPAGSGPVLPSDAWSSPATGRLRQWALVALAAVTGLALAVSVLVFLAYRAGHGTRAITSAGEEEDLAGQKPTGTGEEDLTGQKPAATGDEDLAGQKPTGTGEEDLAGQKPAATGQEDLAGPKPAATGQEDLTGQKPAATGQEDLAGQTPAATGHEDPAGQKPAATGEEVPAGPKPVATAGQRPPVEGPPGLEPPPKADPQGLPDDAVAGLLERFGPLLNNAPFEAPAAPADDPLPPVPAGEP